MSRKFIGENIYVTDVIAYSYNGNLQDIYISNQKEVHVNAGTSGRM